jgi:M6 family metalloprotease-like protein
MVPGRFHLTSHMLFLLLGLLSLGVFLPVSFVQAAPLYQESITLTGWLNLIYGDPPANANLPPRLEILLSDSSGEPLAQLIVSEETARPFNGQYVEVSGEVAVNAQGGDESSGAAPAALVVIDINRAQGEIGAQGEDVTAMASGAQPFINLLCRFPNHPATPHDSAWYAGMMSNTQPGLDHYWRAISYDTINLNGTSTIPNWVVMPFTRESYLQSDGYMNLGRLAKDCAAAADSVVNFPSYVGINMMFNTALDCCAWGGSYTITADGQTKTYRVTWMADWIDLGTLAHEMGHGFGFPHSSGPWWDPPSELNIYVSRWDVMSDSDGRDESGFCYTIAPSGYGCVPPGTIGYHLDIGGWIPANRKVTVGPGIVNQTITIERLRQPPTANSTIYVKVPIGGSSLRFYTIEARMKDGYDVNTPGVGVIIHEVDRARQGNAGHALVVLDDYTYDVNDGSGMWLAGETFQDNVNDITIEILSQGANNFTVRVTNQSEPIDYIEPPTNVQVTAMTANSITITWEDNSQELELGFNIWASTGSNSYNYVTQVAKNTTTYTHNGLGCGQFRSYLVTVFDATEELQSGNVDYGITNPCQPSLNAPANNSQWPDGRPLLTWNSFGYSALTYEIYLDSSPTPTTLYTTTTASSYRPPTALPIGTYYWQIRAVNEFGNTSPLSGVLSFSVTSPANAAPVPVLFTTGTPELTWNRVSWAVGYEIQVENVNNFAAPYAFSAVVPADQLAVTVSPALPDGTYYMRVRALKADGSEGGWSVTEVFVIDS